MAKTAMIDDNEFEDNGEPLDNPHQKRKRIMILLLPLLIVIGISVGIYFALNNNYDSPGAYNIVQYNKDNPDSITVFYDLPEIKTSVKSKDGRHDLNLKITLELSSVDDLRIIEILTPKLNNALLSHIIELNLDEIEGSTGLYWLREELLYRFNLVSAPVKIKNLNFSVFELQK